MPGVWPLCCACMHALREIEPAMSFPQPTICTCIFWPENVHSRPQSHSSSGLKCHWRVQPSIPPTTWPKETEALGTRMENVGLKGWKPVVHIIISPVCLLNSSPILFGNHKVLPNSTEETDNFSKEDCAVTFAAWRASRYRENKTKQKFAHVDVFTIRTNAACGSRLPAIWPESLTTTISGRIGRRNGSSRLEIDRILVSNLLYFKFTSYDKQRHFAIEFIN